jgi:hypothetical protein
MSEEGKEKKEQKAEPATTESRENNIDNATDAIKFLPTRPQPPDNASLTSSRMDARVSYFPRASTKYEDLLMFKKEYERYLFELRRWETLPWLKRKFVKKPQPPFDPQRKG